MAAERSERRSSEDAKAMLLMLFNENDRGP